MGLKETFQKQGGMRLIKQYAKSGSLGTAVSEFLLLGRERTALEILRLSTQFKAKQKLSKRYGEALKKFDQQFDPNLSNKSSDKVWICWFQGIENAPQLVRKCYQSVKKNLSQKEILLITSDNLEKYVQFPDYIMEKWKSGIITHTHLTDLLRLELLIRYGGIWLDATVLCTEEEEKIPKYFFDSDLFFYQCLKPGRDGHSHYISSWLMSAKTNNKILTATRALLYEYWKNNKSMDDYYLLHDFLSIVLDYYQEDWAKIYPRDNATPHILLLRLFDRYDEELWQAIKAQTAFHKLSYKLDERDVVKKNTFYDVLINDARSVN